MKKFAAVSLILGLALLFAGAVYSECAGGALAQSVLRLHIIANSDSPEDQALKLKVRDRLLNESGEIFAQSGSAGETRALAKAHLNSLMSAAKDEIKKNGFDYEVDINIGKYDFPTKRYGNVALPAGEYDALRVKIGRGEGQNWWCVMFPPLCFVDSVQGTVDAKDLDLLKNSLGQSEYDMITAGDGEIPVKIKFKVVELFQSSMQSIKAAAKR